MPAVLQDGINHESGKDGHEDVPVEKTHGDKGLPRGYDAVGVEVEVATMLL